MKEGSQRRRRREGTIVASSQRPCPSSFLTLSLAEDSAILGRCWSSSKKSGWSPRFYISSEFPGNADVSVQEPHWNSSLYARSYTHFFQTSLCPRSLWEMGGAQSGIAPSFVNKCHFMHKCEPQIIFKRTCLRPVIRQKV